MDSVRCDIIIPVWNELAFTRECVESIVKTAGIAYRLVIIDNGSAKPAREYLESLEAKGSPEILLIRNDQNMGFVKAVNEGMRRSNAALICVMNNDTLAAKGWLAEMVAIAEKDRTIGIVNPSSNNLGQKPSPGEPIAHYAAKMEKEKGNYVELGAAVGFCMLIKREVMDRIGMFDEAYGMGNFEDTDFSRRAVKEGYRCVRACGAYVYHRERSSFKRLKTFNDDFRRNREIFEFRWGTPKRFAYILDRYDAVVLNRLRLDALRLAREGSWVWCLAKERVAFPEHSNIIFEALSPEHFYLRALFKVLKKKKKFNEIGVGDGRFGMLLERLAFIHKAKVKYFYPEICSAA